MRRREGARVSTQARKRFWQLSALLFFANAFAVSASFFLFFSWADVPQERLATAALVTFANVVFITLMGTSIYLLYAKLTVDRPLREIEEGLGRIAGGDLAFRISPVRGNAMLARVAESINHMAEGLGQVETLKTGFISDVSHELKTPLTVMRNYARLLQEPGLTEEQRSEYAAAIADASDGLANMVTNILRLNRLENQREVLEESTFDLGEQLAECLLGFEEVWEERGIEVEPDLAEGVAVTADRGLLAVVWNNLLSNAFKFTEEGGTVYVTLAVEGGQAIARVRDTGCGMTDEEQARIFDKFYQGDTSHATQGNGLGLALAKRIVDLSGGAISVESAPGEGSAFTVRLPLER